MCRANTIVIRLNAFYAETKQTLTIMFASSAKTTFNVKTQKVASAKNAAKNEIIFVVLQI